MTQLYILLESQSTDFDPLAEGVTALISGMLTVFLILILIAFVISRIQHIKPIGREAKNESEVKPVIEQQVHPSLVQKTDSVGQDDEGFPDEEVVAVIMATIAASMDTTVDQLVVRSFKRLHSSRRIR